MIFVFRYQEQKSGIYRIWPEANQAGHLLQTAGSDYLPVSQIAVEYGPVTVCNFEVAEAHDYFVSDECVLVHNAPCPGRMGRQARLKEIMNDPTQPSHIRGWLRQEANSGKGYMRNPPGYELAHRRGFEAKNGFSYAHSDLQLKSNHSLQHKTR